MTNSRQKVSGISSSQRPPVRSEKTSSLLLDDTVHCTCNVLFTDSQFRLPRIRFSFHERI